MIKDASLPAATTGSVSTRRFAIVVSRYHHHITSALLKGALETLATHKVPDEQIRVAWVPGSWELPSATQKLLKQNCFDACLCFGCVVRGETSHDQHINTTVSESLGRLQLEHEVPIGFGLLTCNTMEQAIARAGGEVGNKGIETAEAVIEMLKLFDSIATER